MLIELYSCIVSPSSPLPLLRVVLLLRIWLRHEEGRSFDLVYLHKLVSSLWHRVTSLLSLLEPLVEVSHLFVFDEHVIDCFHVDRGCLCALALRLGRQLGINLLVIEHGGADLVLSLKDLDLSVVTPDHLLEARLLLETMEHSFMEVEKIEGLLAKEVLDVVSERCVLFLLISLLHRLDTSRLELDKGRRVSSHLTLHEVGALEDSKWPSRWLCQMFE